MSRPGFALLAALLASAFVVGTASAQQSFGKAAGELDGRLKTALGELADERARIAKEKVPLSRSVSRLEDQVLQLKRKHDRLLEERDSRSLDLSSLRRQVESLGEQNDFVESRLNEFTREFEGRLDISELPQYEETTTAAKLSSKNVNLDAREKRKAQLAVVTAALARLREQLGGQIYGGEALGPDGILTSGRFLRLGPTIMYSSEDGTLTGIVENRLNAADPVVVPLPAGGEGISAVAQAGAGLLPLDSTLGKALKVEKSRKALTQYVAEGGVVGYVILGLGAAALLLAGFKSFEILGFRVAEHEQVDLVLEELSRGSRDAAAKRAAEVEGVAGDMLSTGVRHAEESRSVLEELLFEKVLRVRPTLERFLPFLAITAAAAPLLGLLGTVIGMIKTFQLITIFGTGDAKSLSSGISEALVTTALGLIVAIPTLIIHGALSRMAKRKLGLLEELSAAFINGITAIRAAVGRATGVGTVSNG